MVIKGEGSTNFQTEGEGSESGDFSFGFLLSQAAVAAFALDWHSRSQMQGSLSVYFDFVKHLQGSWAQLREAVAPFSALKIVSE